MKKIAVFIGSIILAVLIAALFGALHDQVTYTLSPEYYTHFKYGQFGLEPQWFGGDRPTVAIIGAWATWWMGLFIGIILSIVGLLFRKPKKMFTSILKAILLTIVCTIVTEIAGFFSGMVTASASADWIPAEVTDKKAFYIVGFIHDFAYMGGMLGLIAGIVYMVVMKRKAEKTASEYGG